MGTCFPTCTPPHPGPLSMHTAHSTKQHVIRMMCPACNWRVFVCDWCGTIKGLFSFEFLNVIGTDIKYVFSFESMHLRQAYSALLYRTLPYSTLPYPSYPISYLALSANFASLLFAPASTLSLFLFLSPSPSLSLSSLTLTPSLSLFSLFGVCVR